MDCQLYESISSEIYQKNSKNNLFIENSPYICIVI